MRQLVALATAMVVPTPGAVRAQAQAPASTDTAATPPPSDEIIVTGTRSSTIDVTKLLRAQQVYQRDKARYAPTSELVFQLKPKGAYTPGDIRLHLATGTVESDMPVDADGRFRLPAGVSAASVLYHNKGRVPIVVRAIVLSDGATEARRPLGDYRLQCRVNWEMMKDRYSFVARAGFGALGGCSSAKFAFYFPAPARLSAATYTHAGQVVPLPLTPARTAFRPPIADDKLPNGTIVQLAY